MSGYKVEQPLTIPKKFLTAGISRDIVKLYGLDPNTPPINFCWRN